MEEFKNKLPRDLFESTNYKWNELMLNHPWSVGYVTTLIELKSFSKKKEWEQFYYKAGEYRDSEISKLDAKMQNLLNDESLIRTDRSSVLSLPWHLKNWNFQHGRTKSQLAIKGGILFEHMKNSGSKITLDECTECVRFRTICQTWNGVIIQEHNTIKNLKKIFPNCEFKKTEGEFDFKYAVDYEIYNKGHKYTNSLICGIQIKPKSYTYNAPYLIKAKSANKKKNDAYFNNFGRPVYDIISKTSGEIISKEILGVIKKEISLKK